MNKDESNIVVNRILFHKQSYSYNKVSLYRLFFSFIGFLGGRGGWLKITFKKILNNKTS